MSNTPGQVIQGQWVFPAISNRPGLSHVNYRIGAYPDFRQTLVAGMNHNPVLSQWTHREPDDPGLALLEGAAILGDILTFYQEFYANDAYLRTARFQENIAELVRLLGYRLSPGLGGTATFAAEVKGKSPVVIPMGVPIQAQLATGTRPTDFESSAEVVAYPGLNRFHLYQPLRELCFSAATREFYIASEDHALTLEPGDRLLLGTENGTVPSELTFSQMVTVESVRDFHGIPIYRMKGNLTTPQLLTGLGQLTAYRIKRSFSHFGYNAPLKKIVITGGVASEVEVTFVRSLTKDVVIEGNALKHFQVPLEAVIEDLAAGTPMVCQALAIINNDPDKPIYDFSTVVRSTTALSQQACSWGLMSNKTTWVTLDGPLYPEYWGVPDVLVNIHDLQLHEVVGSKLAVRVAPVESSDTRGSTLLFYGSQQDAEALDGRNVSIQAGDAGELTSTLSVEKNQSRILLEEITGAWKVNLDQNVELAPFRHQAPFIWVFGNLVSATQGKTEKAAILGNGDSRQIFQTFKLPKTPLTFLEDPDQVPPEKPELEIFVNNHQWQFVPSFFGHGPKETIFVVRQDAEGNSWIQFGDGKTGACLPSGVNNVQAVYRTGIAAAGPLALDAKVQAKLDKLDKISLLGSVLRGVAPEIGEHARQAAPGRVQSLGRLVSLQDYEIQALALGLAKAKAAWARENNIPFVQLTVLPADTSQCGEQDLQDVQVRMDEYNSSLGSGRNRVQVSFGTFGLVFMDLSVAYDGSYRQADVEAAIRAALGQVGSSQGLMSLEQREFGQAEYANRVLAVVQNSAHVLRVKMNQWGYYAPDEQNPGKLKPVACTDSILCPASQILSLQPACLTLQLKAVDTGANDYAG